MCDKYIGKYGFTVVDDNVVEQCKDNQLIIPCAFRYLSMGYGQIIADVQGHPGLCFDLLVGGSDGLEAEYNNKKLLNVTLDNAIKLDDLNLEQRM